MRNLPPKPKYEPTVVACEATPDGCVEVNLELGGKIVQTLVYSPSYDSDQWVDLMHSEFRSTIARRC